VAVATPPRAVDLYRTIRLIRRFEERAIELVASGEIPCGFHPCIGQEAVAAGVCAALRADDAVMSTHRGHGHFLARGSHPGRFLAELAGRTAGLNHGHAGAFHPSDPDAGVVISTSTVGHSVAIATGVAWAMGQQAGDRVLVAFFGDGAANQGALLESLNLASLWRVPALFVCENNGYATTVPVASALAGSVVGRGEAFGIPSASLDGMDAEVVYKAAAAAVARIRAGGGPALLELLTYRFDAHHTFERKVRLGYRDEAEVARWRERDPLALQGSRVPDGVRARIDEEVDGVLDAAVRFAVDGRRPDLRTLSGHLYANPIRTRTGAHDA
jgi:pyruvate dehydrogenase E1 component alpha subunit